LRVLDEECRADLGKKTVTPYTNVQDVTAYFEGKTKAILDRYGPGPRVHYHNGLLDDPPPPDAPAQFLRRLLVDAQERLLRYAAESWGASFALRGDVLDVGCGLGGGSIFWAQEFGARVTAVTCVPSHIEWVSRFAAQAGVGSKIEAVLCDAAKMPGENRFDAVVAVDSSGYLPRGDWFRRLACLLRPGGRIFIVDCFLARPENREPFDCHWRTNIGTIDEYVAAAHEAGLRPASIENISHRTQHFWTTTLALSEAEVQDGTLDQADRVRREASLRAHALVRKGLGDGGLLYALMSFSKAG